MYTVFPYFIRFLKKQYEYIFKNHYKFLERFFQKTL